MLKRYAYEEAGIEGGPRSITCAIDRAEFRANQNCRVNLVDRTQASVLFAPAARVAGSLLVGSSLFTVAPIASWPEDRGSFYSLVGVAWAYDFAGDLHYRVIGDRLQRKFRPSGRDEPAPWVEWDSPCSLVDLCPVLLVYPDLVVRPASPLPCPPGAWGSLHDDPLDGDEWMILADWYEDRGDVEYAETLRQRGCLALSLQGRFTLTGVPW